MKEVLRFLAENPVQYLATVGLDGKPRNRPFMFCLEREGRLWFCTNNQKDVYRQLQRCPYVEITAASPSSSWIRISGRAVFENHTAVKELCMENLILKKFYGTAENPIFEVFYLAEAKAVMADLSGWTSEFEFGREVPVSKDLAI